MKTNKPVLFTPPPPSASRYEQVYSRYNDPHSHKLMEFIWEGFDTEAPISESDLQNSIAVFVVTPNSTINDEELIYVTCIFDPYSSCRIWQGSTHLVPALSSIMPFLTQVHCHGTSLNVYFIGNSIEAKVNIVRVFKLRKEFAY